MGGDGRVRPVPSSRSFPLSGPGTGSPRRPVVAAVGALLVVAAVLGSGALTDRASRGFADLSQVAAAAVAALAAASAGGRRSGRARLAWIAVALGCGAWAAAAGVAAWYQLGLHADLPSPSAADIGYLAFPAAMGVAVLAYPGRSGGPARVRRLVDAAVATAALLVAHLASTGRYDDVLLDLGWLAGFAVVGVVAAAIP